VTQVGTAPAFASVTEAMDMAQAALGYLAAADAAQLDAATQAEALQGLERTGAISTAVRAYFLSAFTAGQRHVGDADYSPRAWLMHKTRITRGAAAAHTAWAKRAGTHPRVVAALAAGELSESYGRMICTWTDRLPGDCREAADAILLSAAAAGMDLPDLARLAAEIYERSRSDLPDEDPARAFEDRDVRLVTTFQGAGVLTGDLIPECAAVVGAVLDTLSAPAGAGDDRTHAQRYHDALHEAMRQLRKCIVTCITQCSTPNSRHSSTSRRRPYWGKQGQTRASSGDHTHAGPAMRSYSTFMRPATSCSGTQCGWEQARRLPEPQDQYRSMTHAHVAATGVTRHGAPAAI
jgi:Domain of unknown function (DUF222)